MKKKKRNVTRRSKGNVTSPGDDQAEVTLLSPGAQKQKLFRERQKKYLDALEHLETQVREKEPKKFKAALAKIDEINRERRRFNYYW